MIALPFREPFFLGEHYIDLFSKINPDL